MQLAAPAAVSLQYHVYLPVGATARLAVQGASRMNGLGLKSSPEELPTHSLHKLLLRAP